MKKTVLVVVLLCACGKKGGEAPKGDCAASVENAVSLSAEEYRKSNITPETITKIKEVSITRCNEDKWSDEILKCLVDAKATPDVSNCQQKMTKEQNDNMAKAITAVTVASQPPESETPPEQPSPEGPAGAMPPECVEYKVAIEKLATCDKLPQDARDTLKQSFDTAEKAWATFDTLPDDAKKAIIEGCTKQVETVRKVAAACNL